MSIGVASEIGRLRKVLVHRPGPEWDLVPCGPGALSKYLIEDIFVLSRAQREHDSFTEVLRMFIGDGNVMDISDLLEQVCRDERIKVELIGAVTAIESLGLNTVELLHQLSSRELADALIRGAVIKEDDRSTYVNLFPPLPNLLFTRDLGVALPEGFLLAHAATSARRRETLLMRHIMRHEFFRDTPKLDILSAENEIFWHNLRGGESLSLEGGDVLVINHDTLFIGTGERTTEAAFYLILDLLEEIKSSVRTVIRAILPKERASMHLDTVITAISKEQFMIYSPVINRIGFEVYRSPYHEDANRKNNHVLPFAEVMRQAGLRKVTSVECGGACEVFRSREQWTDGANLFAVGPGVLLGYDRNEETTKVLTDSHEYQYLQAGREADREKIEEKAKEFQKTGRVERKVIIGIPGSELSRARGGPRCMTMPLARDRADD